MSLKHPRLIAVCLVVPFFTPTVHGQSLGELAKTTQQQRDKAKADEQAKKGDGQDAKVKKVYTDKDLAVAPSPTPASPGETKPEAAVNETATGTAPEKTVEPAKDEAYWRERMATLRGNLARDKAVCEPIAAKLRQLDALYADSIFYIDGKAMVNRAADATIETKRVEARAELQQCSAKVVLDQAAISAAEEEARRLNVLPGWLR